MDKLQQRLVRGSRRLAVAFTALFWFGLFWLFAEAAWRPLKAVVAALPTPHAWAAVLGLSRDLLAETPAFALMGALWTARGLFGRFASGEALTPASGRSLSIIGGWFLASLFCSGVFSSATSLPPAPAFGAPLAISTEILLGCVGAMLILLGRAFSAAAAIKADLDQIV
jgi:hypothetical protein